MVWVFGTFGFALYVLIANRKHLEEGQVKRYFMILYQGLRPEVFYWEFVNTFRKILVLSWNVILSSYDGIYRAMISIVILIVIFRIQIYLKPYKNPKNNEIEMKAILIGALTLFWGAIFITNGANINAINSFIFILLIASNTYFVWCWILAVILSMESKSKYTNILIFIFSVITFTQEYSKNNSLNDKLEDISKESKINKEKRTKKVIIKCLFYKLAPNINLLLY